MACVVIHRIKLWCAAAGVLALAGCARPSDLPQKPPPVPTGALPTIAVIAGGTESYWDEAKRGARDAGKKFGASIVWETPSSADLVKSQQKLVRDAIKNSHGIVLAPLDSTKLMQPVGEAAHAGLAVVIFNRDVYTIQNKLSYVHNDDYRTGVLAAREAARIVGASGKRIGVLASTPDPQIQERVRGFEETLHSKSPGAQLEVWTSLPQVSDVSARFLPDAASALLMRDSDGSSKATTVLYGPDAKLKAAGGPTVLIVPDYYQMAYQSVKAILDYRAVKDVPREIKIAPHVVENKTTNEHK
jgi:ABC-type sugar transport system substrate-binding protein